MTRTITVRNADGKEVSLTIKSTAATRIMYRQVFRRDLYKDLDKMQKRQAASGKGTDGEAESPSDKAQMAQAASVSDFLMRLTYIMAMSGAGIVTRASQDGYIEWLENMDEYSILSHGEEVLRTYAESLTPGNTEKNLTAQLSGN